MAQLLQDRLQERVEEARKIAGNLYAQMPGYMSRDAFIGIIREAIRPILFNDKHGYIFILALRVGSAAFSLLKMAMPSCRGWMRRFTRLNSKEETSVSCCSRFRISKPSASPITPWNPRLFHPVFRYLGAGKERQNQKLWRSVQYYYRTNKARGRN